MNLYPAIDIKGGACVRLIHGDMAAATHYNADPGDQARRFVAAGCKWIHVVDLDGAVQGEAVNGGAVAAILKAAREAAREAAQTGDSQGDLQAGAEGGVQVQLGGGIRHMSGVEAWLEAGVSRVVLGTAALKDPGLVRRAAAAYPGQVAVAADARGGMIAAEGWVETSDISALDLIRRFEDCGVAAVIFTDIGRDGTLEGVNLAATAALARAVSLPVIASGGVASIDDIRTLAADKSGIEGVITGRALYDGRLDLAAALAALKEAA